MIARYSAALARALLLAGCATTATTTGTAEPRPAVRLVNTRARRIQRVTDARPAAPRFAGSGA